MNNMAEIFVVAYLMLGLLVALFFCTVLMASRQRDEAKA
jgi:hypothetical protein